MSGCCKFDIYNLTFKGKNQEEIVVKPCTDVARDLFAIDSRFNVCIACDGLQQKFQNVEYFACDPLTS